MRALVTGGAGFIGSNLVDRLVDDGHAVTVLDNLSSGDARNLEGLFAKIRFVEGDIRVEADVVNAMTGADVVFHLAASVGNTRSIEHPRLDAEVNVLGTVVVLECARALNVRRIVASSSAAIFGQVRQLPMREDHPAEPESPYGATKLCMEKECLSYARVFGLEAVCLRYFNVYGPNQRYDAYGNVIPIFVTRMLRGEALTVYGDGRQTRDFVNVRDVVQANMKAALVPRLSGAFNIGSGRSTTIRELVDILGVDQGSVLYASARPGDVLHSLADISSAREAFGFAPAVSLSEGIAQYVSWAGVAAERGGS